MLPPPTIEEHRLAGYKACCEGKPRIPPMENLWERHSWLIGHDQKTFKVFDEDSDD
jgi:ribosome modulation factor